MKKKVFVLVIAIAILLSACSRKITQGEVIDKSYTPAHSEIMLIPVVTTNGKTTTTRVIPYMYFYNDRWDITIRGRSKEGEVETATYRVTRDVYDAVEIGAEFVYDKDFEPGEPEYTREQTKN